jgi:hypothetical protein
VAKLDRRFQSRFLPNDATRSKQYRSIREVRLLLQPYHAKRYVFLATLDAEDRQLRNTICVPLVRLAQRGNLSARCQLLEFLQDC